MKKLFTLAMLFAAAATAFVSCSKDDTTDLLPGIELSGRTKSVTISSSINTTRTKLDGHNLKWVNGDTFGIFYVGEDGSSILGYVESPAYDEGTTSYTLADVPEETKYFYCVYPYDADHIEADNLKAVACHIPDNDNMYEEYKFNGKQHLMAAKAEIAEDDTVAVTFSPLVSILEFNIYDSEGLYKDCYFTSLRIDTDNNCSGDCTVDFTGETPTLNDLGSSYIYADCDIWKEKVSIPSAKEEGVKAYALIAPGKYDQFDLWFKLATDEYGWDTTECKFSYGSVTFSAFGHTINIDLSWEESTETELVSDLTYEVKGPWLISAKFNVSSECVKYVIGGMPTEDDDQGDGLVVKGYDEETFISDAEYALATSSDDYSKWYAFTTDASQSQQTVTELYLNGKEAGQPIGLRLNPTKGNYTVAVYAVDGSGNGQVYTTTFDAPAFSMGNGSATPSVVSNKNQQDSATATISADGAEYIFYGYSNTLSAAPTEAQINAMYTANEMDTYFVKYESPVTLDFKKYGKSDYIVWAVAVDAAGAISSVASQTFEYQEDVVDTDGSATINSFEALHLWQVNDDDDSPIYELEAKFSLSDDAAKVAIFYLADSATKNADNPITLTVDIVRSMLISEMNSKNGLAYTKAEAEKGIRLPISTIYEDSENKTGAKPETSYYMFAVATDADGAYGNIENLAWVGGLTVDQPGFLLTPYTIEKSVEKEEKGGGDSGDLWTSDSFNQSLEFYKMYELVLEVHDKGAGATKMWVLKLDSISGDDVNYNQKAKFTNQLGQLFKDYATEQKPSSNANILASFEGDSVPHSGSFTISETSWAQNWQIGDVFAVVADFGNNVLGAKVCGIDSEGDWTNICTVNASNKPQL